MDSDTVVGHSVFTDQELLIDCSVSVPGVTVSRPAQDVVGVDDLAQLESSIAVAGEKVTAAIDGIGRSSISDGLMVASIAAVVGAFSAFVFTYMHWRITERKNKLKGVVAELKSIIKQLEILGMQYWVAEYEQKGPGEWRIEEIQIKACLRSARRYSTHVSRLIGQRHATVAALQVFEEDIFDQVTGDGFESKSRVPSTKKAVEISNACIDMRAQLEGLTR